MYLFYEMMSYIYFYKSLRPEGKVVDYTIFFSLFTLIFLLFPATSYMLYLVALIFIIFGLKYIVRIKVTMYELLPITIMLVSKMLIELTCLLVLGMLTHNQFILDTSFFITKVLLIFLLHKKMPAWYSRLRTLWYEGTIKIRYIYMTVFYIYSISVVALLIHALVKGRS